MSSAFDKTPPPEPSGDDGSEHTRPLGPPAGYGAPQGPGPSGYPPPPGYAGHPEYAGQPGAYGQPGPGGPPPGYPPYGYGPPDHPRASTSMVLGILGLVLCQVVAPFAWVTGRQALREIDASGGRWGGRGQAQAGYVLGIVGTVILGLAVVGVLLYVLFAFVVLAGAATGV